MIAKQHSWRLADADHEAVERAAAFLSLILRPGDVVGLTGDLGAGKTTFARALIGAFAGDGVGEVPSPTFSLLQTYATSRLEIRHFDLYRLRDIGEIDELGLLDGLAATLTLIEWPAIAAALLPPSRFDVSLECADDPARRTLLITGTQAAGERLRRLEAIAGFAARSGFPADPPRFLQGDASRRAYARIGSGTRRHILVDSPPLGAGPTVRGGLSYNVLAHRAVDVRPFVAIAEELRRHGLSTPTIHAADLDHGFLIVEDLGDRVYSAEHAAGTQMRPLLTAAVDVLLELRRHQAPDFLPAYDAGAYRIEVDLLLDWTWPALHDAPASEPVRDEFADLWRDALASIEDTGRHWVLRDLHSPNLLWMPERVGLARVGLIDFQDALSGHLAYDLASLLQDARIDLPADLERDLLAHYCSRAPGLGPRFDEREFRHAYAVLGAQRATKILGGFARLSTLDGKSTYLRHLPRIWRLLEANLGHPVLRPLRAWFDRHFPAALRRAGGER